MTDKAEFIDEIDGTFGPLGRLTGDVYRALERARAAKDERCLAVLRWAHERVCKARYEVRGEPWPADRPTPPLPDFEPKS